LKLRKYVLLGAAGLVLGTGIPFAQSTAGASTYHSIPSSMRGYYISSSNQAMWLRKHTITDAIPQGDADSFHISRISHNGHHYTIHASVYMGNTVHVTYRLNRYAKNKFSYRGRYFHKVSKSHYYYYVNH